MDGSAAMGRIGIGGSFNDRVDVLPGSLTCLFVALLMVGRVNDHAARAAREEHTLPFLAIFAQGGLFKLYHPIFITPCLGSVEDTSRQNPWIRWQPPFFLWNCRQREERDQWDARVRGIQLGLDPRDGANLAILIRRKVCQYILVKRARPTGAARLGCRQRCSATIRSIKDRNLSCSSQVVTCWFLHFRFTTIGLRYRWRCNGGCGLDVNRCLERIPPLTFRRRCLAWAIPFSCCQAGVGIIIFELSKEPRKLGDLRLKLDGRLKHCPDDPFHRPCRHWKVLYQISVTRVSGGSIPQHVVCTLYPDPGDPLRELLDLEAPSK